MERKGFPGVRPPRTAPLRHEGEEPGAARRKVRAPFYSHLSYDIHDAEIVVQRPTSSSSKG
jgi:pantothenate kinase